MNILNKVIPFKMRRGLAALGVAGAMAGACKKAEPETNPTLVINIEFNFNTIEKLLPSTVRDTLNKYGEKNIKHIYLVSTGYWNSLPPTSISKMREYMLEPAINLSPKKISGRGDFGFGKGMASQVPQDSLWLVKNGWTITPFGR